MKILHTSDWHLGRSLYGKKRYEEFDKFLEWLEKTIKEEGIDVLLIAGDVFDNSTPGNRAQELYYSFLCRISASSCRHIVVIAGNHDSPSFLNAPRELLRSLNVYVTGSAAEKAEDEVFVLKDKNKIPEALVCAVPYLRDRDIRVVEAGETFEDKNIKLVEGIKNHYINVCMEAEKMQSEILKEGFSRVPLIALGHLFTAGGKTIDGDGVRDLYVGSLAHVSKELFPENIDYLALGHLHVPQKVGGSDHIRYSGSPIPMGYGEASQEKKIIIVDFNETGRSVREKTVPVFQKLERITGSIKKIIERIDILRFEKSSAWLEIEYTGNESSADLRETLEEAVSGTDIEIRRIKNRQVMQNLIKRADEEEELDDLDEKDVFIRCLESNSIPEVERPDLISAYSEILNTVHDQDLNRDL